MLYSARSSPWIAATITAASSACDGGVVGLHRHLVHHRGIGSVDRGDDAPSSEPDGFAAWGERRFVDLLGRVEEAFGGR